MSHFSDRGYVVTETGPVYFTKDMDKTVRWFEETLGWYYVIDERNDKGAGMYGCVYNIPQEIEILHIAPFTGIHLMYGEPKSELVALMRVQSIDKLYSYVRQSGWEQITEVTQQPWGARLCSITTVDGCELRFFE
jgi:AraC family transcriptional regulator